MEKQLASLSELEREAGDFVQNLQPQKEIATLITLSGNLGAGKTTFTQAVARALGISDTVTSPTFVLEKIYSLPEGLKGFKRLIHIDAYRLENGAGLAPLGFDELMRSSENLVFLEWPEKVMEALPEPAVRIMLSVVSDTERTISYA